MAKTRSYRRLPPMKHIDEMYFPTWPITFELLNTEENICCLKDTFARLYQMLDSVTIIESSITDDSVYSLISVKSTNPKTGALWHDQWRIYMSGALKCRMWKSASWKWRRSYLNKSSRIISTWLTNIIYAAEQKRLTCLLIGIVNSRLHNPDAWTIYDIVKVSPLVQYYVKELPVP